MVTGSCRCLALILGFHFCTATPARADGIPLKSGDVPIFPSIHQLDLERWNARRREGWTPWNDQRNEAVAPLPGTPAGPAREVHGYHPYWLGSSYLTYNWSLISTVAFFGLELGASGAIVDDHGWPWTGLVSSAHAGGTRVIVTATLFSSSALGTLLADPARRATAIANLTTAVAAGGADGVNIDFEGVPGSQKQNLVTFLNELRTSLAAVLADPYLSIATPAVDWNDAFDYDELAAACNHLMVMAYNYHWPGSPGTGPVAPLSGWGAWNVTWTVNDYRTWGTPSEKILLGVPYYGYRWPAVSSAAGAATTASGTARTFAQAITESESYGRLWDAESGTPWTRWQEGGWLQTWFDDAQSLGLKYDMVTQEGLGGAGIWALGYDGSRPELWEALERAFGTSAAFKPAPPPGLVVSAPYPNPAAGIARFEIRLDERAPVRAGAYDAAGRLVGMVLDASLAAGRHEIVWDTRGMPPGLYFLRFGTSRRTADRKIVISR